MGLQCPGRQYLVLSHGIRLLGKLIPFACPDTGSAYGFESQSDSPNAGKKIDEGK